LTTTGFSVHLEMARLHRLVEWSNLRLSSLHSVIQVLTLWDFHILHRMELWQRRCGGHVRRWLAVLGEVEALTALAALAHDHPDGSFPEINPDPPTEIEALGLEHPLLPGAVANDVTVGPPGTFLLVTGSNMSGKSTLLRALGVNVVLAQAGGPVFARHLRMPPLRLGTSILVEDSLLAGVSYFMAELQRLKAIVDLAEECADGETRLLFLLDEVLRGTNSEERQAAVRRVLSHLLAEGALGAVSTHDLHLAELPDLAEACRPVHFRETVGAAPDGRPKMTFDYLLRPGVATTRNALKLLELVGLAPPNSP
jgi:DNA mismatch repair ATPase MutS